MGLAIARAPAASDASRKPSAPLSSRWLAPIRQGGRSVRGAGGELESRDEEKEAHWTLDALSPPLPKRAWDHRWAKPGTSHFARRRGEVAQPPSLGGEPRSGGCPKRTRVLTLYIKRGDLLRESLVAMGDRTEREPGGCLHVVGIFSRAEAGSDFHQLSGREPAQPLAEAPPERSPSWLAALVCGLWARAFAAERLAALKARKFISTRPSALLGSPAASPESTAPRRLRRLASRSFRRA